MSQTDGPSLEEILHLTTLAEVFGGFAHEIAQPLNAIMIASQVMQLKVERSLLPETEKTFLVQRLGIVTAQVQRAGDVVETLRNFTKETPSRQDSLDLEEIVRRILTLMGQQFAIRGIEVDVESLQPLAKLGATSLLAERSLVQALAFARDLIAETNRTAMDREIHYDPRMTVTLSQDEKSSVARLAWNPGDLPETRENPFPAGLRAAKDSLAAIGGALCLEDHGLTIQVPL